MPCFSRIATKIKDRQLLIEAAKALGYEVLSSSETSVVMSNGTTRINFSRYSKQGNFSYTGVDSVAKQVCRKYAELKVRKFAKKKNMIVTKLGNKLVLKSF